MPKRKDLKKIMVIGSGPIVIGQGAEFDYAGTQACLALKEEGYEVILVNSNPATIARFHTIVYTPSCVTTDFTTPGRDVYSYEFKCQSNLPAYGWRIGTSILQHLSYTS